MTRASGGWKTIAGEESDDEDDSVVKSPEDERVPSPTDMPSPTSAEVANGPERRGEMKPGETDAEAVKDIARAAAPTRIQTEAGDAQQPTATPPHPSTAAAKGLPDINVILATPLTPERPPHASRSSSMPGSFNGDEDEDDVTDGADGDQHTKANPAGAVDAPTETTTKESEDIWGVAARMKKLMLG